MIKSKNWKVESKDFFEASLQCCKTIYPRKEGKCISLFKDIVIFQR